jgi:subtilisin family serine protease
MNFWHALILSFSLLSASSSMAYAQIAAGAPGAGAGGSRSGGGDFGYDASPEIREIRDPAREIREQIRKHKRELEKLTVPEATPSPVQPRPLVVRNIPKPALPPLRTLGRPALLDAEYKPQTIVALIELEKSDQAQALAEELGLTMVAQAPLLIINAALVELKVPEGRTVEAATRQILEGGQFLGAQPDYLFELQQDATAPTSPLKDLQYAPSRMAVAKAHELATGEQVTIAVIDTGVDLSHGEFAAENFRTFDAVGDDGDSAEPHGTAIAGLIAARGNMVGIAPGARILAVRAFAEAEDGRFISDSFTIAQAIDWAVRSGADILNMSFAGPADPLLLKLMDELGRREVHMVAAAGNQGINAPAAYPAAHPATIAVTATDAEDALYQNANRGRYVTIAAPGVDVIAPAPGNSYDMSSGTSIATAHVTGVVALMLSRRHDLSQDDITSLLGNSATDFGAPGPDPEFGYGLVDAFKATMQATDGRDAVN